MSLIIKIAQNGSSQEYLFNRPGPISVGADPHCDLPLTDEALSPRLLEIKRRGSDLFIRALGQASGTFLDGVVLPNREEVRYLEGAVISVRNQSFQITIAMVVEEGTEPPPFFETEFKERIERLNFQLRDREAQLRKLTQSEDRKKHQLGEVEARQLKVSAQQVRLEADVERLKRERSLLLLEL